MTNNFKTLIFATILSSIAMGCSTKWTQAIRYGSVANTENKETVGIKVNKKLIIVPVYLGGKKYRFLFDTGAPFSISKPLQKDNDFRIVSKGNIRDSDHNRKKVHWVKVDSIRVGSILFTNQTAFVGDFEANPVLRCLKIDGIIGSNLIRHCNWTIDQEHQTLSLFSSIEKKDFKECTVVPFRTDNQYNMFIDVNFGRAKVKNVLVDYGSNGSVALNNSIFSTLKNRHVISNPFLETGINQSGIIGKPINFQRKLSFSDSVKIDKLPLKHVVVRTGKTVSVGNNLLSRFHVTIDWENKNLYLTKAQKATKKAAVAGFSLGYSKEKGIYIQSVIENSNAFKSGIRPNMRVVKLDNLDFEKENDFCDYVNHHLKGDIFLQLINLQGQKKDYQFKKTVL